MASHHDHAHGARPDADRRYLWATLALLTAFMAVEVVVAFWSGSLALLSDAGHMLSDVGAVAAALWAMHLAARPITGTWTFGLKRAEILSAAINGLTLVVVAVLILIEALRRLLSGNPHVAGGAVLVVALAGCVVNVLAVWLMAKANRSSLNIEGAYQHILTDLYAFLGTAIAGVVILLTGWTPVDTLASLLVVASMLYAAWGLLRDSGRILLEGTPDGTDLNEIRQHLLRIEHVHDVHDLHAWTISSNLPALSAHLVLDDSCFADDHAPAILDQVQACLHHHFDLEHSTLQFEPAGHITHESGRH